MTVAALNVQRKPPLPSPDAWFRLNTGQHVAGWAGSDLVGNAVTYNGRTYIGLIDGDGTVRVVSYNHATKTPTLSPAIVAGLAVDNHNAPAVMVRQSDSKLLIAVCQHSDTVMYVAVSTKAEDVSAWGSATNIASSIGAVNYTYPVLVQLSGESGKIYLFYREQRNGADVAPATLCYSTSTNGGSTWAAQTRLYENATSVKPYWAIDSDSASRIDFCTTDGDAKFGESASVYHFYYDGSRRKTDGTVISSALPLAPSDLTKIYDSSNGNARAVYTIIHGANPVALWTAYDPAGSSQPQKFWYGSYSAGAWSVHEVDDQGSAPDADFGEGGAYIDRTNGNRIYFSRKVSSLWQIQIYETTDGGATWTAIKTLTADSEVSQKNLRPISPKNAVTDLPVVWLYGQNWLSTPVEPSLGQLRGYPNPIAPF